jgi:hypothetical protein
MVRGSRAENVVEDHGGASHRPVRLGFPGLDRWPVCRHSGSADKGAMNGDHASDPDHFLNGMTRRQRNSWLQWAAGNGRLVTLGLQSVVGVQCASIEGQIIVCVDGNCNAGRPLPAVLSVCCPQGVCAFATRWSTTRPSWVLESQKSEAPDHARHTTQDLRSSTNIGVDVAHKDRIACGETLFAAKWLAMKVLAVSDQVVDRIYELIPQGHFADVQMIVGCGDLPYDYLEYMLTMLQADLFYVPGNHDPEYNSWAPAARVEGGINLDLKTVRARGLLLAGFGGSVRYRPDGMNQYTQTEGLLRAARLLPGLLRNRLRYGHALDILVTHSPPFGIHDDETRAHRGLKAINLLLRWARPRYHLHGHLHYLQHNLAPDIILQSTTSIVNVYPYRLIEIYDER